MRYMLSLVLLFLPLGCVQAQITIEITPKKLTHKEYKEKLKTFAADSKNLTNEEYYSKWQFKNRTGKVTNFSSFTNFEKQMFYLIRAEVITKELKKTNDEWQTQLKLLKEDDEEEEDDKVPSKEQAEKYHAELLMIRKRTAVKYETVADKLFNDYADKFTVEEKERYLRRMKAFPVEGRFA